VLLPLQVVTLPAPIDAGDRAFTSRQVFLLGLGSLDLVPEVEIAMPVLAGLGLLLLSEHHRSPHRLHYLYGSLSLLAVLSPWLYAPTEPRARLLWFAVAALVAAALGVRAFMTA